MSYLLPGHPSMCPAWSRCASKGKEGRKQLTLKRIQIQHFGAWLNQSLLKRYELCHKMGFKKSQEPFWGGTFSGQKKTIHLKHRGLQESNLFTLPMLPQNP